VPAGASKSVGDRLDVPRPGDALRAAAGCSRASSPSRGMAPRASAL